MKARQLVLCVMLVLMILLVSCTGASPNVDVNELVEEEIYDSLYLYNVIDEESDILYEIIMGGDRWIHNRIESIINISTHVVHAEVLDYRIERINTLLEDRIIEEDEYDRIMLWHTIHRLRVLEVFRGDVEVGDIIEIAEICGDMNSFIFEGYSVPLVYGDEFVFFLYCYETHGFAPGPMEIIGGIQGVYQPPLPGAGPDIILINVTFDGSSIENDLVLTVGHLERIAEESGLRPAPTPPPEGDTPGTTPAPDDTPYATPAPGASPEPTPGSSPEPTIEPDTSPTPSPTSSEDSTTTPIPQTTSQPTQSPTPTPTPPPADDTINEPILLLRFEIGSLYYTTQDGQTLTSDAAPFISNNRAYIPLRIIAEALGAEVTWNRSTRTGYMTKDGITIPIAIDSPLPDGMGTPVIINNRTFVPARYISETFGAEVRWDRENSAVYVYWPE